MQQFDSFAVPLLVLLLLATAAKVHVQGLDVGAATADITGPAAEVPMMGYAEPSQKSAGIHIRLFARAFAFRDKAGNHAAFVTVDAGMISQMLRLRVNEMVQSELGKIYSINNVVLTATHTHSGPGGFHGYTLYAIAALGYVGQTFDAMANGIAKSIITAHRRMRPARLFYNEGQVPASNINRSPSSYLRNPAEERSRYADNVDRSMELVKIVEASSSKPIGMINWHPVHCTSMNNTNLLISGDNKGWAAQMFERYMERGATLPGNHSFVAAFANANEGDVSPNTDGPRCADTGKRCDILTSTCGGNAKLCYSAGPGADMFDSTRIIGIKQFATAKSLFESASSQLSADSISFVHESVDMSAYNVTVNGKMVSTCPPAMGFSFAAGTTDGPGGFDFTQGDTSGNKFWNIVRNIISKPDAEQARCQHPKPILLNTGYLNFPTAWQPSIVETQLVRIGDLVLVALPGEFTTMAGRRLRQAVQQTLASNGMRNAKVILCGLSNLYTSYITTYEEYQAQRYEAASTIFGPHTLSAYIAQFTKLAKALAKGEKVNDSLRPPNLHETIKPYSFVTPVVLDSVGIGNNFGDVLVQPHPVYRAGDVVSASFRSSNPRNNLLLGSSYLTVQRLSSSGVWEDVCNDACVETRFRWVRTNELLGRSEAHTEWHTAHCVRGGTYRLVHRGSYKPAMIWQPRRNFLGITRPFQLRGAASARAMRDAAADSDAIDSAVGCGCV